MDFSSTDLRWFFNGDLFASYLLVPDDAYPVTVEPRNATLSALVGGVVVQILAASHNENNPDLTSFLSIMTVSNITALREAGVSTISCGSFTEMKAINLTLEMNRG